MVVACAADIVTGSNALAHNEQPQRVLEGAKQVLSPDGVLSVEVMYAGDLLELMQWDTLYHEHLTFYSLGTLRKLLDRAGFTVVEAERIVASSFVSWVTRNTCLAQALMMLKTGASWNASVPMATVGTWPQITTSGTESAIESRTVPAIDVEHLTPPQRAGELAMLLLRLSRGLNFDDFSSRTNLDARRLWDDQIQRLSHIGLLDVDDRGLRLSDRGVPLAEAVASEFLLPPQHD